LSNNRKLSSDLLKENLNRIETVDLLISLLNHLDSWDRRNECIEILETLELRQERIFRTLESIMITDPDKKIRLKAANLIRKDYLDKAISPMDWALEHEDSYECLITVINTLKNPEKRTNLEHRVNFV